MNPEADHGWTAGMRVWLERDGAPLLGQGRADLLAAIDEHRSITKAAKAMGMSYRRAWLLVQDANQAAGKPLVESAVGGTGGGGARLTEHGRHAVKVYRQLRQGLAESSAQVLQQALQDRVDSSSTCIHVAAAISLQDVVTGLLARYGLQRPEVVVRPVFGASDELAAHVAAGAPCDLFLSAEPDEVDWLESQQLLVPDSRRVVAINRLVFIGAKKLRADIRLDDLASPKLERLALADETCPLGRCSTSYLQKIKMYERLLPKVLRLGNSRSVPLAVAAGVADVGLAFHSDAVWSVGCHVLRSVPKAAAAAHYVGAIVNRGTQREAAESLLGFLTSSEAAETFLRCGFEAP